MAASGVNADFIKQQVAKLTPDEQAKYQNGLRKKVAAHLEKEIDAEIQKLEELTEDDLNGMRKARMRQLHERADQREKWRQNGHGTFDEIMDQKQFFQEAQGSERVIIMMYTHSNRWCKVLGDQLAKLASLHYETRFLKMDANKAQHVCGQLEIEIIPALILCKNKKIEKQYRGLDAFTGGSSNLNIRVVEQILHHDGFLEEILLDNADKMDYIREQDKQLDEDDSD